METVYRDEQVSQISSKLGISKKDVTTVLSNYTEYLKGRLNEGKTIKLLNICYIRVDGKDEEMNETLAYISTELGKRVGINPNVVYRVFTSFEELLIRDLRKLYSYNIRGLVSIKLEKNFKDEYKVRIKKSTSYVGNNIYVSTCGSFKRKAEILVDR